MKVQINLTFLNLGIVDQISAKSFVYIYISLVPVNFNLIKVLLCKTVKMFSLINIMKRNCAGVLLKSLNTQNSIIGNKCLFPLLQKENLKSVHASTSVCALSSNMVSNRKSILLHSQSDKLLSRSMSADHSHSKIWTMERFLSAGLIGLLPMSLAYPNPAFDYALALALTIHVHWGIEAIVVDYARPSVVGATLSRAALAGVYALSVLTLGGLFYFNYSDVGLSQAIRMLWKL